MFGTALATSPIMSSNYIGTRVFTLGVYLDVFVEDQFPMIQNSLFTGDNLKLDPVTVQDNTISQVHVLEDVGLLSLYHVASPVIRQVQFMVPLGQYLETFVAQITIAQNHVVSGEFLSSDSFIASGLFNQRHNLTSSPLFLGYTFSGYYLNQIHLMSPTGLMIPKTVTPNATFSQNHVVSGEFLSSDITIEIGEFNQNHVMLMDALTLEQVILGTPFVNPSTKRVVNATDDSQNYMMIVTGEPNIVLLLNPDGNKYS